MAVIETAAMTQKVEFSADEMAEQAASTGKITLHGILFDTAKTEIKPESNPVLDEVAAMMKKSAEVKFGPPLYPPGGAAVRGSNEVHGKNNGAD